jgi:sugar phosphate isomerase/epimerase
MEVQLMRIAHNGTSTMFCSLLMDIQIAKQTGYDAIEIVGAKLERYLEQGLAINDLLLHLQGLPPVAVGYVQDIERQEPVEYAALLDECEQMCSLAQQLNCPSVQLLTGPLTSGSYKGLHGLPWPEIRRLTARNLAVLADIGARYNVGFYLEPLNYAPLGTLQQTLELLEATERDNVGMVIDFWHMWDSGATPEEIARLDRNLIVGVHFCDSREQHGQRGDEQMWGRAVWTGGGNIPLKEWVDAVVATGFDGWWSCELFSPRHWELDPWVTAQLLKDTLRYMLL